MRAALAFTFIAVFASSFARADEPPPAPAPAAPEEHHGIQLKVGDDDDASDDPISKLPPDVRSRLTGDQVENILRRSQEARTASAAAAVVPGLFFLSILGIVIALAMARQRRERVLHETLRQMIEKGVEIPEMLLVGDKKKPNDRRRGIILCCVGLGLSAFFLAVDKDGDGAWGIGLVPMLLGVGYLVAWFVEKRER